MTSDHMVASSSPAGVQIKYQSRFTGAFYTRKIESKLASEYVLRCDRGRKYWEPETRRHLKLTKRNTAAIVKYATQPYAEALATFNDRLARDRYPAKRPKNFNRCRRPMNISVVRLL